jgi:hypothetical protein
LLALTPTDFNVLNNFPKKSAMKGRRKTLNMIKKENNFIIPQNEKLEILHMEKSQCSHLKKSMN